MFLADRRALSTSALASQGIAAVAGSAFNIGNLTLVDSARMDFSLSDCYHAAWNSDGTKVFLAGASDGLVVADLSVAYDISTATAKKTWLPVDFMSNNTNGIAFNSDGTKFFWLNSVNTQPKIYSVDLSVAYDLFSYDITTYKRAPLNAALQSLVFKSDGTKFFGIDTAATAIAEYSLSSAWDITSLSFTDNTSVSTQETGPQGLAISSDGTKFFVLGDSGDDVNEYNATAWDASTISFVDATSISAQDTQPRALFFNAAGTKLYFFGRVNDSIFEYSCTAFDASTISFNDSLAVNATNIATEGLFIGNGGLSLYTAVSEGANGHIRQYDLSTAFDLTGISYLRKINIEAAISNPQDVIFNSTGTKMLVLDGAADDITEYTLGTGWDISTNSIVDSLSVATQQTDPTGLSVNSDGTRIYVSGAASNDNIYRYNLSTGFDVSTGSFSVEYDLLGGNTESPQGVEFSSDGLNLYVATGGYLTRYELSSAFDLSTARFSQLCATPPSITGIRINSDGTKIILSWDRGDTLFEYELR